MVYEIVSGTIWFPIYVICGDLSILFEEFFNEADKRQMLVSSSQ